MSQTVIDAILIAVFLGNWSFTLLIFIKVSALASKLSYLAGLVESHLKGNHNENR